MSQLWVTESEDSEQSVQHSPKAGKSSDETPSDEESTEEESMDKESVEEIEPSTARQPNEPVEQCKSISMEAVTLTNRIDSSSHIIGIGNLVNEHVSNVRVSYYMSNPNCYRREFHRLCVH